MPAEYCLKVIHSFSCAHYLRNYVGRCARMHGHDYKVEVEIATDQLDDAGLGVDCADIKVALLALTEVLDHRCANDIAPFTDINPSAENIAAWFYRSLQQSFKHLAHVRVKSVILHETEKFSVKYSETP